MVFCSYPFLLFLAVVLLVVRLMERAPRLQLYFILAASSYFYGYWDYRFLALLWIAAVIDFYVAIGMERYPQYKRLLLVASLFGNLGQLAFFKYFDFFQASTAQMLTMLGVEYEPWLLEIILPVGISFYTFQTLSYTIDVYRGDMKACTSLPLFVTFVCYFPQLVAGPIERAPHLVPQLARPLQVRTPGVLSGLLLIVWGSFKKAVVADIAGLYIVDPVFPSPSGGLELWLATIAFGIQIYCDFSGYCDIARGSSRCMGIELVENFRAPYLATSITDFWRRWHISLSTWLRDYLYISLGGNRRGKIRTYVNLWLTMFLCGLWHGANLTFVVWGMYHGALLLIHRATTYDRHTPHRSSVPVLLLKGMATFILVTYGWMLFRIEAPNELVAYTRLMLDVTTWEITERVPYLARTLALLALPLLASHLAQTAEQNYKKRFEDLVPSLPLGIATGALIAMIFSLGTFAENLPFIYFQF